MIEANSEAGMRFVEEYNNIVTQRKRDEKDWVKELRRMGVKACHPNDGWVDRKNNKIHLCYPLFNDGIGVGDKIMIGSINDKKSKKLVEVTRIYHSLLTYYYFEYV